MQINEYPITATIIKDEYLFDMDAEISVGVWQSQKVPWSLINDTVSLKVGTTKIVLGVNDRVLYQSGGVVSQSPNLTFDDTLRRLQIKATTGGGSADVPLLIRNSADNLDILRLRGNGDHVMGSEGGISLNLNAKSGFSYTTLNLNGQGNTERAALRQTLNRLTFTHTNSDTVSATLTTSGLAVGFGDIAASAKMDIKAAGALSTDLALRVRNSAGTADILRTAGNGSFQLGLSNGYQILYDATSPSLKGITSDGVTPFWKLSNWTNEDCYITSNASTQVKVGIGTIVPSEKLHVYTNVNDTSIKVSSAAATPTDESVSMKFATTWAGAAFGQDAAIIRVRTKGTNTIPSQKSSIEFNLNAAGTNSLKASITSQSNFLLGNPIENTADNGVIYVVSGTAPATSVTDGYKQYSADIVAGNAAPHFRTENGAIIKLYQETTAITGAAFVSGGAGSNIKTDDTFGGYTLQQIAAALKNIGILA